MTLTEQSSFSARSSVRALDDLRGPAGRLEALYTPGHSGARYAALVCHPHPLFGGTMHNKVVYHAAKVFQGFELPVLRFNFRGAGASEGTHDSGRGEQQDLAAAVDWLKQETGLPILLAGFSFGAWVSLSACCGSSGGAASLTVAEDDLGRRNPGDHNSGDRDPGDHSGEIQGLVALGLPIQAGDRGYSYEFLTRCALPKLFISGSADAFGPVAAVEAAVAAAMPPSELVWIEGADHFFQRPSPPALNPGINGATTPGPSRTGGLLDMQQAMRTWLASRFIPQTLYEAEPGTAGIQEPQR